MSRSVNIAVFCAAFSIAGCTTVVYHVAEKPAPEGDGIFVLRPNGSDRSAGPEYAGGRDPHVAPDGNVLFIKQGQVFRGSHRLTNESGTKRSPTASMTAFAYVNEVAGQSPQIIVRSFGGTEQMRFFANATGLAFHDNGRGLLYSQADGVYSMPSSGSGAPALVAACLTTSTSGCGPVSVSHNGQYAAYYTYMQLAATRVEYIQIVRIGTWQPILRIARQQFCPTCVDGVSGTPEQLGSFAFSPDDKHLYATVRVAGSGTDPAAWKRSEIFRLKLNLADIPPTVSDPERLTDNGYPDHHPSARRQWWFE